MYFKYITFLLGNISLWYVALTDIATSVCVYVCEHVSHLHSHWLCSINGSCTSSCFMYEVLMSCGVQQSRSQHLNTHTHTHTHTHMHNLFCIVMTSSFIPQSVYTVRDQDPTWSITLETSSTHTEYVWLTHAVCPLCVCLSGCFIHHVLSWEVWDLALYGVCLCVEVLCP